MSHDDTRVLKTMRAMAWERAKGELYSILNTFWGEEGAFEAMRTEIEKFCAVVDSNGLVE